MISDSPGNHEGLATPLHFASNDLLDDGKNMPHIPRYNTQKYREWKAECVTYLSSPTTVCMYMHVCFA